MAQKNRANMLTDIVSNIYNNLINFITGQNAQDRFVNLLDSSPNILSDKDQANGYVGVGPTLEIFSSYYDEEISRTDLITELTANLAVGGKFYRINDAVGSTITLLVIAESNINLYSFGIDATTGEIGTYDITTDVFSPIVSSAQTLSDTLILGNTSGANDIEFDATQGLLFANSSRLREGTIDAGLGGLKGIAQICGAGYELKWENGRLYVMGSSGNTIRQSLYNFSTAPTTSDDVTLGYQDGSLWTLDNGDTYECTVAATGTWILRANVPDLQQVTTAGATTTVGITVDNGTESVEIKHDRIKINNASGAEAVILSPTLATTTDFRIPNKATSPQTFAMLSDVTANPMTTGGDIIYGGTSGVPTRLANGTAGQVLQSNGTTLAPSWAAAGGGGDVYLANDQTFTGENTFAIGSGNDTPVTITKGGSNAALKVTKSSGSGDAIEVAQGSVSIDDETASTIASFDGSKRIKSLATATYPSLTELSYVKGATSAIQTQLNALKVENLSLQDGGSSIAATTYTLELYAQYAYTINELKIISASGTCTVSVKINGVDVTGISAVSVSSTIATGTATASNTVAIGDKITLVTTSNSALTNLQASLKTTRI
jgi:hypothetical protein